MHRGVRLKHRNRVSKAPVEGRRPPVLRLRKARGALAASATGPFGYKTHKTVHGLPETAGPVQRTPRETIEDPEGNLVGAKGLCEGAEESTMVWPSGGNTERGRGHQVSRGCQCRKGSFLPTCDGTSYAVC